MGLIEPVWPSTNGQSFRDELALRWGESRSARDGILLKSRIQGFAGPANEHLPEALAHPNIDESKDPAIEVVQVQGSGNDKEVTLRLCGAPMRQVSFTVPSGTCKIQSAPDSTREVIHQTEYVMRWAVGERVQLRIRFQPSPWGSESVHISGRGLISRIQRIVPLEA